MTGHRVAHGVEREHDIAGRQALDLIGISDLVALDRVG